MKGSSPPARQPIFNLPPMIKALLAANIVVHLLRLLLPPSSDQALIEALGFVPARFHFGVALTPATLLSPLSYQFLHGGLDHLGINMLGLVAFGSGVEQRLGAWRFLLLYLLCGVAGAFTQWAVDPGSPDVLIGASAAVSGAFGAILRFRVFRRGFWFLVILWLILNAVTGVSGMGSVDPIAWMAHTGGFILGLLLFPLLLPRDRAA